MLGDDSGPRWRLLVLEDAGELIVHDAGRTGALATLLNLTDGILGHGTGTLVLITTNEPVEQLHPAVRRRGRCLADLEFGPLSLAEAKAWALARRLRSGDRPPSHAGRAVRAGRRRRAGAGGLALRVRTRARAGTRHHMTTLYLVAQQRGERAERILTGLQWTLGLRAPSRPRTWDTAAVPLPGEERRRDVVERLDAVDPDWRDVVALV